MTPTATNPIPDRSWTRHLMLAVAVLLLLSSAAHGSLGLSTVRAALAQAAAPADVVEIVTFGWLLGSVAQFTFAGFTRNSVTDSMQSTRKYSIPDTRIGTSGCVMRAYVYLPPVPGTQCTLSSWIDF